MAVCLASILGVAGFFRAAVFLTPWKETFAITSSLFMIVLISIVLGSLLPLLMKRLSIDPAHSSTTIQVIMDILGVCITVWMSSIILGPAHSDPIEKTAGETA
jgi:Mg/Co/Ni transporter MgtE